MDDILHRISFSLSLKTTKTHTLSIHGTIGEVCISRSDLPKHTTNVLRNTTVPLHTTLKIYMYVYMLLFNKLGLEFVPLTPYPVRLSDSLP